MGFMLMHHAWGSCWCTTQGVHVDASCMGLMLVHHTQSSAKHTYAAWSNVAWDIFRPATNPSEND
jgi:hypothetical protein